MSLVFHDKPLGQGRFLRSIGKLDLDAIHAIEKRAYPIPWSYGLLYDCITGAHECLMLTVAGEPVGYTVTQNILDEAHLLNIAVDPDHQGKGLGELLLQELILRTRVRGGARVFLEVRVSNVAAQTLYQKLGFRQVGMRKAYYPAVMGREDGLVMLLEFAAP